MHNFPIGLIMKSKYTVIHQCKVIQIWKPNSTLHLIEAKTTNVNLNWSDSWWHIHFYMFCNHLSFSKYFIKLVGQMFFFISSSMPLMEPHNDYNIVVVMTIYVVRGSLAVFVKTLKMMRTKFSRWLSLMQHGRQHCPASILIIYSVLHAVLCHTWEVMLLHFTSS